MRYEWEYHDIYIYICMYIYIANELNIDVSEDLVYHLEYKSA